MIPVLLAGDGGFGVQDLVSGKDREGVREAIALVGVLVAVTILLFVCVALFRKRRRKLGWRHYPPVKSGPGMNEARRGKFHFPWQRHHHRRQHRPRNPTLAETGGLPPIRKEESSPPPP
jgi:hypothetical protein